MYARVFKVHNKLIIEDDFWLKKTLIGRLKMYVCMIFS